MSRIQQALAREIRFAYVEATTDYLAERASTSKSGATLSLRVMEGNGWVRQSMSGGWSLTEKGDCAFDLADYGSQLRNGG